AQKEDIEIWTIVENLDKQVEFRLDDDNFLWQDTRLVVPNDASLREALLTEAHSSPENFDKQVEFRIDEDNVLWQDTRLAEIFQQEIVRLHGTPSAIVS
nr:putative reverse transcriptase domain-containing protein [Tanacetum cinerariifolium]